MFIECDVRHGMRYLVVYVYGCIYLLDIWIWIYISFTLLRHEKHPLFRHATSDQSFTDTSMVLASNGCDNGRQRCQHSPASIWVVASIIIISIIHPLRALCAPLWVCNFLHNIFLPLSSACCCFAGVLPSFYHAYLSVIVIHGDVMWMWHIVNGTRTQTHNFLGFFSSSLRVFVCACLYPLSVHYKSQIGHGFCRYHTTDFRCDVRQLCVRSSEKCFCSMMLFHVTNKWKPKKMGSSLYALNITHYLLQCAVRIALTVTN